jgi:hypothetical protein
MPRSLLLMLLFALATLVIAIDGVLRPERKYISLLFFVVGLVGTWRQYLAWRRDRSRAESRADTHPT